MPNAVRDWIGNGAAHLGVGAVLRDPRQLGDEPRRTQTTRRPRCWDRAGLRCIPALSGLACPSAAVRTMFSRPGASPAAALGPVAVGSNVSRRRPATPGPMISWRGTS